MANRFPKISLLNLDWNDLKFFLAVARGGSLTQAGQALDASPSTVSRHIDALEQKLGVTLFLRRQSGYVLSDQGQDVLAPIVAVEQAMLSVERHGQQDEVEQVLSGKVRLATAEGLAAYLVVPNLPTFHRHYPHVQVEILADLTTVDLRRREADLALRFVNPAEHMDGQDLIANHLGSMRFGVYCARRVLGERAPILQHLAAEVDCIAWSDDWAALPMMTWLQQLCGSKAPVLICNHLLVQHQAVRAGVGLAVLPDYVGSVDNELVRLVTPDELSMARDLWVVYHRDLKRSRRVVAMRDFLKDIVRRLVASE